MAPNRTLSSKTTSQPYSRGGSSHPEHRDGSAYSEPIGKQANAGSLAYLLDMTASRDNSLQKFWKSWSYGLEKDPRVPISTEHFKTSPSPETKLCAIERCFWGS